MQRTPVVNQFFGSNERSLTVEGIRLVESRYDRGLALSTHSHDHPHICLVLSGGYTERVWDLTFDRSVLTLLYYPPRVPHEEFHRTPGRHLLIEIERAWRNGIGFGRVGSEDVMSVFDRHCVRIAYQIQNTSWAADDAESRRVKALVCLLLSRMAVISKCRTGFRSPPWLSKVVRLVRNNLREPPSLARLANQADVHPCHLTRVFRRAAGCNLSTFVLHLRTQHACDQIMSSDRPLSSIASESGFADQSHMSREVRRWTGTTPTAFRTRQDGCRR